MRLIDAYLQFIEWRELKRGQRTINGDISHLAQFCLYMRDPNIDVGSIVLEDCMAFLKLFRELGFDENTIIKKALALKLLFEFLRNRDYKVLNPEIIPVPKRLFRFPRVAEEWEYKKLLSIIPEEGYTHIRNKAIIKLLWESGARNGEIASLSLDDIDLVKMSARIKTEKSRGTIPFREIFWREDANNALKNWIVERDKLAEEIPLADPMILFFGIKGGHKNCPSKGKKLQHNFISEILRKYSNKAGLPISLNPHSCRHHFGRELAQKDANTYAIASLLGHANVQSSYPYTMLFGKDRERVYRDKMDNGNVHVSGNGNGHYVGNGHSHSNGQAHINGNGHANGKNEKIS